jgi:isoleucyl-tRNA synthetase
MEDSNVDYNKTISLPKTEFPMRAALPKREPGMLEEFYAKDIYGKMIAKNEGKPLFVLHDGPPYANGDIHIGTALNKILKDMIIKYKNMTGYQAPYVPGWDTHGLPIESAILKKTKLKRDEMSTTEFREQCKDFALSFRDRQRDEFKRLGVLGDWDDPYLTLKPAFEAEQIKIFGEMAKKGYIYKGLKPVYWCPSDETALAEAEIEYADDPVTTIYVKFRVKNDLGKLASLVDLSKTYFVIWTTTTWTLPGNQAICLNADFDYVVVRASNGENYIMAKDLAESVLTAAGLSIEETICTMKGAEFELMTAQHPLFDRESLVINGAHVTLDAGTGCVHTAPSYGADDFAVCKKYPQIDTSGTMDVNVNAKGVFTASAGKYAGIHVFKAHAPIFADLQASGALLHSEDIVHSYPHCWRCKNPVIFRATEQWFCSVDAIKQAAVDACDGITWYPEWGKERMTSMIRERSDWCISRQRTWGVPIPIFYCEDCGKEIVTEETIEKISNLFREHGSNIWFEQDAKDLLPDGFVCPHCGGVHFTKETDIMDVWFDSGSSHAAVLRTRPELKWPADVYLEGGDQYRGWFQSSMLTSIAAFGQAPYKTIITHGWTVDGEGRAMHKSLGNAVSPDEVIKDYGADLLRLWVASSDYRQDMRISKEILKQLSDSYLKIRNTARYMIGNLAGFDPDQRVPFAQMMELDKWAVIQFNRLVQKVRANYDVYEFHPTFHAIRAFCTVEMSSFYLDIIKDRLYCEGAGSFARRSAQSAMYTILDGMVRLLAPILAFTSEEIWQAMPHASDADGYSVLLNQMPDYDPSVEFAPGMEEKWDELMRLRTVVNKALELARAEKRIGKNLDAAVTVYAGTEQIPTVDDLTLYDLCIVSSLNVVAGDGEGYEGEELPGVHVAVVPSEKPKCQRCWKHDDLANDDLCPRCAAVVAAIPAELLEI